MSYVYLLLMAMIVSFALEALIHYVANPEDSWSWRWKKAVAFGFSMGGITCFVMLAAGLL